MKRWHYLIGLAMVMLFPVTAFAMPAYPGLVKMKQPDGEEISVYLKGDEKVHWMESPEGYSLLYDKEKRIVFATTDETGRMIPSSIIFQDAPLRSSATDKQLAGIPKNLRYSDSQVYMLKNIWNVTKRSMEKNTPKAATGTIRAVCVLVQFPDRSFTKTREDFVQLLNQAGYNADGARGSVRDFYYENSYGQLDLIINVVGPYTAIHNLSYYGENDLYGNDNYEHIAELAGNAATYAFSQPGINPADYDNDNDGYIDAFHFIYAGYGEEAGADKNAIWAHETEISSLTFGNKKLNKYSCSPELRSTSGSGITRIGVICHEMGHIFGLPEFYDTDGANGGSFSGMGKWDVMAGGAWNGPDNDGSFPAHNNMYSKIKSGWVNPVILDSPREITNMPNSAMNPAAYIYNSPVPGEYFILENRQQEGFDTHVPGNGLLVYHVSLTDRDISQNKVNNSHPQKIYPVCASSSYFIPNTIPDSYGSINSSGCPFPGTSGKTSFTDYTSPSSVTWSGLKTNKPITEIKEQNKLISFKFLQADAGPVSGFTATKEGNNVVLQWNKPNDKVLGYNIYRDNRLLIKLTGANHTSYTQNKVDPGAHNYCVTAYYEREESTYSCQEITVEGDPNKYPAVGNLDAKLNGKSVELSWISPKAERDWVTHSTDTSKRVDFGNTSNFSAVVRFSTEDLKGLTGSTLSQVRFYLYSRDCKHTIQIWHFAIENSFPDVNPMISQTVENAAQGVFVANLNNPLKIEAGKELWIGIKYELNPMVAVAVTDNGPKMEDRNFVIMNNRWYPLNETSDYNFSIAGGLLMSDAPDKYNVYRDNTWLNNAFAEYYLDNTVPEGNHIYCISAVYGSRESEQVCVQSPFMTGIINPFFGTVKSYPNPLRQGDLLTIDLGNDFADARISFYSVSGQLLLQVDVSEPVYRQKIDFIPGVYTLQIKKNTQVINRKIIVK